MTDTPIADMTRGRKLSRTFTLAGMNIKGNPPMRAAKVAEDLEQGQQVAEVIVTQEMRWTWYFRQVARILKPRQFDDGRTRPGPSWGHAPRLSKAVAAPVFAAQAVFWRADLLRRRQTLTHRLHRGRAKISESRQLRAVLLQDREHDDRDMAFWAGTTHFVVGADAAGDGPIRQDILYDEDLPRFDRWLETMAATGHPIIVELDANIHRGSAAYDDLLAIVHHHGGRIVGEHGVEYLIVIPGSNGVRVDVLGHGTIPTRKLNTDHEGRLVTFRLRKPRKMAA